MIKNNFKSEEADAFMTAEKVLSLRDLRTHGACLLSLTFFWESKLPRRGFSANVAILSTHFHQSPIRQGN